MTNNKRIGLVTVVVICLYLLLCRGQGDSRGDLSNNKVTPIVAPEISTPPSPAKNKPPSATGKQKTAVGSELKPKTEKMELLPSEKIFSETAPVDMDTYSYSIRNEKKERKITPGVVVPSGKTVIMKIPGDDAIVRVQRDSTYHNDSYNVFWEKKY